MKHCVSHRPASVCSLPSEEWNRVFAHRVIRNGECIEFAGARTDQNYGRIRYKMKRVKAHRLSFLIMKGDGMPLEQLKELVVRHTCDNPPCINPDHLLAGTNRDNYNDMIERKRAAQFTKPERLRLGKFPHVPGEKNARAKLKKADVLAIRSAYAAGVKTGALVKQFNMSSSQIHNIITLRCWKPEFM